MSKVEEIEREFKLYVLRELHGFIGFPPKGDEEVALFRSLMATAKDLELTKCSAYYANISKLYSLH